MRNSIKEFEKNMADNIKGNQKYFWKYVNPKTKEKQRIPDLKVDSNKFTSSDQEKIDILNKFFTSVFTREDFSNIPPF